MGLVGQLVGDIGGLSELRSLWVYKLSFDQMLLDSYQNSDVYVYVYARDLSSNSGLTGPISPRIGDLKKLDTLWV